MENILVDKISKRTSSDLVLDQRNAILVVVEEIILSGIARTNLFQHAYLYGPTYQNIFYRIPKYSLNLEFALYDGSYAVDLEKSLKSAVKELLSYGIKSNIDTRLKSISQGNQTLFLRIPLKPIFELVFPKNAKQINKSQVLSIKCSITTTNNKYVGYQLRYILEPTQILVKTIDESTAYSLSIRNILFSKWSTRVSADDLENFIRYSQLETSINYQYLDSEMRRYGDEFPRFRKLDLNYLKKVLKRRFEEIDFDYAYRELLLETKDYNLTVKWDKYLFLSYLDNIYEERRK